MSTIATIPAVLIARGIGAVRIGEIEIIAHVHFHASGRYCLQARSAKHGYPRASNVEDALKLIGVTAQAEIEGNEAGLWARVNLNKAEMSGGNAIAALLMDEADARFAEDAAAKASDVTAEA
jgi:hypothetical protein